MKFIKPNMCRFVRPFSAIFEVVTSYKLHDFFLSKRFDRRHDSRIYTKESNGIHLLTILTPFWVVDSFVLSWKVI